MMLQLLPAAAQGRHCTQTGAASLDVWVVSGLLLFAIRSCHQRFCVVCDLSAMVVKMRLAEM
jgi:hypothetical protein